MAVNRYVAYCGGKWEDCTWKPPHKNNVSNIVNASNLSTTTEKNKTDADAFIFEKDEDSGNVQLHVFKTCCSPKMTCTYSGAGKIINDNTNIWQKIIDKGTSSEIRVMADYDKFSDASIRIGSYGRSEEYEGFASPSTVEYSFINANAAGNDIPEATNPSMFEDVSALTTCNIPCQMRFISDRTFYNCKSLTSYSSPDWIDTIGVSAFEKCTAMTNLVVGKNAVLSTRSFAECTGATTIEWSNTKESENKCRMTEIADGAFQGCTNLRYTKFSGSSSAQDAIIIPRGITEIGSYAFEGCTSIKNLKMYDVTTINDHAFQGCVDLHGITGMSNVTYVGDSAFNLSGSTWTANTMGDLSQITTIGEGAFSYVKFNGSISLNTDSHLSVGDSAFYHAEVDGSVTIPSNLSTIPYQCFYGLSTTGEVYIYSDNVGEKAFSDAVFGGNVVFSCGTIGYQSFNAASFYNKDLNLTYVYEIACQAFHGSNVESVTFRDGVVLGDSSCEYGSFESCDNLRTVTFNGDATVGKYAFYGCDYLTTVTFSGDTTIYSNAFEGTNLQNIYIEGTGVTVSRNSDSFQSSGPVVHLNGYTKGSTAPADFPDWVKYYEGNDWQAFQIVDSTGAELYAAGRS